MKTITFDGYREMTLTDHCVDDRGRLVPREDFEAAEECRAAFVEERRKERALIDGLTFTALGMLVAVLLIVIGEV